MVDVLGAKLPDLDASHPHLGPRAAGWLRHVYRKATVPDDWSEDGEPAEWWDRTSQAPMMSFPRFDLSETSYAIGTMADQTPAWREVYAEILGRLVERHITFWGAVDWLTQFGPDPRRGSYPQAWIDAYIPDWLIGQYDTPGWVANGAAPWGLQPDPIGADGNLFFKGWLNLVQSLHAYVTGEDRWGDPFLVAGVDRTRFEWTQHRVVDLLVEQWRANPKGPHCENTKIWPFCLSAAGLGLQLYDAIFDRSSHQVYDQWLAENKDLFFAIDRRTGELERVAFYHDPLIDYTQWQPPLGALPVCFYLAPQEPVFAEYLYHAAVSSLGWNDPKRPIAVIPEPRRMAVAMTVAREFEDDVTVHRLTDYAEQHFEPRYFGDGEFGFWFGLDETWPRGQLSACAMVSEVGRPGAWSQLFRNPNLTKFDEPTLEGVDYPTLGIVQAWYEKEAGILHIGTYAGEPGATGRATTFRVTRLPDTSTVQVRCDGQPYGRWRVDGPGEISVDTTYGPHVFQIFTATDGAGPPGRSGSGTRKARTSTATGPGERNLPSGDVTTMARLWSPPSASASLCGGGCCGA